MGGRQLLASAAALAGLVALAILAIAGSLGVENGGPSASVGLLSVFGIRIGALAELTAGDVAPAFPTGDDEVQWLNTLGSHPPFALRGEPLVLKDLQKQGKTVLLHFFDYTSVESLRSIPVVQRIHHLYSSYGLEVISVHSPKYRFASRLPNLAEAVQRLELHHPVVNDEHGDVKSSYGAKDLLSFFLIDTHNEVQAVYGGAGSTLLIQYKLCGFLSAQYSRISCPTMDQLKAQEEPTQEKAHMQDAGKAVAGAKANEQKLDWYWWYGNAGHHNFCRKPTQHMFVGHEHGKGSLTPLQEYPTSDGPKKFTDLSNMKLGDGNFVLSGDWISEDSGLTVTRDPETGMANTHMKIRYYGNEVYALMGAERMEKEIHMCASGVEGMATSDAKCLSEDDREGGFGHCENVAGAEGIYGWCRVGQGKWGACTPCKPVEEVKIYLKLNGGPLPHQLRGKDVVEDGLGRTFVVVREPRVYFLVEEYHAHPRNLELVFASEGVSIHRFDFGANCSPFMPRAS